MSHVADGSPFSARAGLPLVFIPTAAAQVFQIRSQQRALPCSVSLHVPQRVLFRPFLRQLQVIFISTNRLRVLSSLLWLSVSLVSRGRLCSSRLQVVQPSCHLSLFGPFSLLTSGVARFAFLTTARHSHSHSRISHPFILCMPCPLNAPVL
ncbi:hypothetical protein K466DRAFT_359171 [Polyporus arcularius HHB13444]|uniref:Uncharacterized protein n=1 Tax=Polyporus arcularius HHB13444 TaxID=1314778 RepID=A0A5C3PXU0_9APHY|nr:hypothetical protein K466DRAFT_359171 [Polyporus arcularius HHB13444]